MKITFEILKNFVDNNPDLYVPIGAPATPEMLRKMESDLNLQLPADYRRFLECWGCLILEGARNEYEGIYCYEGQILYAATDYTLGCRKRGLPDQYIAIVSKDGDEYYCLDTSTDPGEMLIFEFFEGNFRAKYADSFLECVWGDIQDNVIPIARKENRPIVEE